MNKREAKRLSLQVWKFLYEHPKLHDKFQLPVEIWDKIYGMRNKCPLCEYFDCCHDCPLKDCTIYSLYSNWCYAESTDERQQAAKSIYDKIKGWEVK